ncbi:MAG: prepilin peptidase [Bacteroidetes bacterium]|nr:prepilin peptidase [Bacteroidota bacterium]
MQEYYFLFGLAFVWAAFATIQDFRKTEIANWLNFSLIAFVLAYRAFYSIFINDFGFFLFGLFGMALFFVLAFAFYYGKIFGGGDAKLLIGLGGILPYQTFFDYLYLLILILFFLSFFPVLYQLFHNYSSQAAIGWMLGNVIGVHSLLPECVAEGLVKFQSRAKQSICYAAS